MIEKYEQRLKDFIKELRARLSDVSEELPVVRACMSSSIAPMSPFRHALTTMIISSPQVIVKARNSKYLPPNDYLSQV